MGPRAPERRMLREVVSIERHGSAMTLSLKCGHQTNVAVKNPSSLPKRGRCRECKPAPCGATHRDGRTCTLENRHLGLHTATTGRGCNYDARQLDPVVRP
jgi:hypothetical protein